jgi:hypothetical protein
MPTQEDIKQQKERLEKWRGTLANHLYQQAILGSAHAPPGTTHGIREARNEIANIKANLRTWGEDVEDHPDDFDKAAPKKVKIENPPNDPAPEGQTTQKTDTRLQRFLVVFPWLALPIFLFLMEQFLNINILCSPLITNAGIVIGVILVLLAVISAIYPDEIKKLLEQIHSKVFLFSLVVGLMTMFIFVPSAYEWCKNPTPTPIPPPPETFTPTLTPTPTITIPITISQWATETTLAVSNKNCEGYWCHIKEGQIDDIYLPKEYWIARHTINITQYNEFFFDSESYSIPNWTPEGYKYMSDTIRLEISPFPIIYQIYQSGQPVYQSGQPKEPPWYYAAAFAKWLTNEISVTKIIPTDYCIRLPTELEWKLARAHTNAEFQDDFWEWTSSSPSSSSDNEAKSDFAIENMIRTCSVEEKECEGESNPVPGVKNMLKIAFRLSLAPCPPE